MYNLNPDYSKIGFSAALYLPSRVGVNRICVGRYLKGTAAKQICSHLWAVASRGGVELWLHVAAELLLNAPRSVPGIFSGT